MSKLLRRVGIILLSSVFLPSFTPIVYDESSLYELWEKTKPTELEKKFDLEHDEFNGGPLRYSYIFSMALD